MEALDRLIAETEKWLAFHTKRQAHIEMLACQIRLKALHDARQAITKENR